MSGTALPRNLPLSPLPAEVTNRIPEVKDLQFGFEAATSCYWSILSTARCWPSSRSSAADEGSNNGK